MSLGTKINTLRIKKGYSQEELAERSGVSIRTIQRIESDQTNPSGFTLKAVAKALDIELESLVDENNSTDSFDIINTINLRSLLGLIVPFGNFIFPYLLWRKHKHIDKVNSIGKRILNFQLLWSIMASLCFIMIPTLQYMIIKKFDILYWPLTWVIFILMLLYNIYKTLRASISLKKKETDIYKNNIQVF